MLVLARAEQGRMPLSQELFTIDSIVDDMLDTYKILAHADHRSFRFHCPKHCAIQFDKQHFRQIIHNLLTNALRHGSGPILVSVRQTPRHVVLSCINAVNSNLKGSTLGVGLGLRLVRALVTSMPESHFSTGKRGNYFVARLRCPIAGAMPALRSSS